MKRTLKQGIGTALVGLAMIAGAPLASAKEVVKIAFLAPLTGAVSADGIGGRNSAELAVKLHNADPKSKYEFQLVALDDECKPSVGVQVATKASADPSIMAVIGSYCSAATIAMVPCSSASTCRSSSGQPCCRRSPTARRPTTSTG
jgi:branched-chain amino acid transport system substrate-binding protein